MSLEKKPAFSLAIFLPFLLVIYFVLHENNDNFGVIPIAFTFEQTFYYLLVVFILSMLSWWLFRNVSKVILFTTLLSTIFILFGALHDLVKESPLPHFFKSYKFILVFLFLAAVVIAVFLKRSHRNYRNAARYVQGVLIILCVWETASFVINIVSGEKNNNILYEKADRSVPPGSAPGNYPNIYFIVFDAYTSSACLREEFGYDNAALDSFFLSHKFHMISKGKSNYHYTVYSIASTLNFSYLTSEINNRLLTSKDMVRGKITVANNRLIPFLESKGYTIHNFTGFDLPGYAASGSNMLPDMETRILSDQTMTGRIRRDILWNFTEPGFDTTDMAAKKEINHRKNAFYQNYAGSHLKELQHCLETNKRSPKFVYCHLLIPHEPYNFNRDGSFTPYRTNKPLKEQYLDQLIYTNKIVQSVVNNIFEKDKANKVIVVEGDHGFREYGDPTKKARFFDNLNAFYFYDQNYNALYNTITPVNTFRVILNQYLGQQLPYLKDTSFSMRSVNFNPSGANQAR